MLGIVNCERGKNRDTLRIIDIPPEKKCSQPVEIIVIRREDYFFSWVKVKTVWRFALSLQA